MRNKIKISAALFVLLAFMMFGYFVFKPIISAYSVSEEKCEQEGDDCWHVLAHQTFNKTYCLKIIDNETRRHCFEHIPEINER